MQILLFIVAYLLGSIPFSVVVGKIFYGVDVRKQGSGNPGATNTLRVLGTKAGIVVLLLDVAKGVAAVLLGNFLVPFDGLHQIDMKALMGAASILGHIFSPFLGFKGGKGVATSTGVVFALQPMFGLIMLGAFVIILLTTRFVSLGSITAAVLYVLLNLIFHSQTTLVLHLFSVVLALIIIIKHKENIRRLLSGTENKFMVKKAE